MFNKLSRRLREYLYPTPQGRCEVIQAQVPVFGLKHGQIYLVRRWDDSEYSRVEFHDSTNNTNVWVLERNLRRAIENGELKIIQGC